MGDGDGALRLRPIRTKNGSSSSSGGWERRRGSDGEDGEGEMEMEPVSPAGRLFFQPSMNCYIICMIGFANSVDVSAFKKGLLETVARHKRFCSVMKKDKHGFEYWAPTQLNIDDHVVLPPHTHHHLHADHPDSITDVNAYAAALASAPPLDPTRPLWDFHILNIKSATSAATCIFRIHHSLGDGISMMSLFLAATQTVAPPYSLPSSQPLAMRSTQKSRDEGGRTTRKQIIWLFWKTMLVFWCTIVGVMKFLVLLVFMGDSQTPLKGSAGVEFGAKSINTATVQLEDMRLVKNAVGGTINDVFLAIVSCGIRRYLEQHIGKRCTHQIRPICKEKLSNGIGIKGSTAWSNTQHTNIDALRIRALSMVNGRPRLGLQEVATMMKGGGSQASWWGNNIAYVVIPIFTRHFNDPLDYVRKAMEVMTRKKSSLEASFIYNSGKLVMKLNGAKAACSLMYRAVVQTTLSLSNVIGPLEEVMFMGNPITEIAPTSYGQPQSTCIHMQSYMGKVTLVLTAAKDVIPDSDNLLQHILGALKDMKEKAYAKLH